MSLLTPRQHNAVVKLHRSSGGAAKSYIELQIRNKICLIDEEDFAIIANYTWHLNQEGYARTAMSGIYFLMHKVILNSNSNEITDHINRNKLDNRKSNLRIVDASINGLNKDSKGIKKLKGGNWYARVHYKGKEISLGSYPTEEWAKKVQLQAKKKYGAY